MLRVEGLHVTYQSERGAVAAVQGVSFEVAQGEFYTLLGPSGCGKTTTLRSIAGLETPDAGRITIGDAVVYSAAEGVDVRTPRREIGMVFQSYAIWPHLTVFENVAFGLRHGRHRVPRDQVRPMVMRALDLVQLAHLAEQPAPLLSGGQQQRVALARALATEPKLLLLDEPLSNLDARLREEMRQELKSLVKRLGITTLYVTHDQVEALAMSDTVAVMAEGRIVQAAPPDEIYLRPTSAFTAAFLGRANVLPGRVARGSEAFGGGAVEALGTLLECAVPDWAAVGDAVLVAFRPETVRLGPAWPEGPNALAGRVTAAAFVGEAIEYVVECAGTTLRAKGDAYAAAPVGAAVWLQVPPERCLVLAPGDAPTTAAAGPG